MVTPAPTTIRRNGRIAELRQARKEYQCDQCKQVIKKRWLYYSVVIGGGGLGSLKYPDRCHVHCIRRFLDGQGNG